MPTKPIRALPLWVEPTYNQLHKTPFLKQPNQNDTFCNHVSNIKRVRKSAATPTEPSHTPQGPKGDLLSLPTLQGCSSVLLLPQPLPFSFTNFPGPPNRCHYDALYRKKGWNTAGAHANTGSCVPSPQLSPVPSCPQFPAVKPCLQSCGRPAASHVHSCWVALLSNLALQNTLRCCATSLPGA